MKIAYIAAGAGNMYCGSCIRDNALVRTLQERGHEALLLPIYTPLRTDEESVATERIFYGAINIYLQQKSEVFARMPRVLRRLLDSRWLLRRIGAASGATDARLLGELTLSMLRGEEGRQRAALEQLVRWLKRSFEPDLIQLTNSMLLGLARRLKEEMPGVKVVTAFQGEDIFLEDLIEPYHDQAISTLRERSIDSDLFVATSSFYADAMSEALGIERDRIRVARLGISFDGLGGSRPESQRLVGPLTIGYLGRICPEKGLHVLVDAYRLVVERRGRDWARLRVAGFLGGRDREYFAGLRKKVGEWGLDNRVEWLGEVDRPQKIELLRSLDVFSLPTIYREPKGLSVLEALACGVPVVQPDHGSFPEILERTGGGILVEPNDSVALADGLETLLDDAERRRKLAAEAREGVRRHHGLEQMTDETLAVYREALGSSAASDRDRHPDSGPGRGVVEDPRLSQAAGSAVSRAGSWPE